MKNVAGVESYGSEKTFVKPNPFKGVNKEFSRNRLTSQAGFISKCDYQIQENHLVCHSVSVSSVFLNSSVESGVVSRHVMVSVENSGGTRNSRR